MFALTVGFGLLMAIVLSLPWALLVYRGIVPMVIAFFATWVVVVVVMNLQVHYYNVQHYDAEAMKVIKTLPLED